MQSTHRPESWRKCMGSRGTSGINRRNRLERHLRDAQTLRHHGFFSASRYETFGQVRLGVPPEFDLVAF